MNFGDQLLLFDFVAYFLFFSAKCGPIRLTSTKGLNIPVAIAHLRSLAATTKIRVFVIQSFFFNIQYMRWIEVWR